MCKRSRFDSRFPKRVFLLVIGAVCAAVLLSALYGYRVLSGFRDQYLKSRGEEVASYLDQKVRGPRMRLDPREWKQVMDEALEAYHSSVEFLALVDEDQTIVAHAGDTDPQSYSLLVDLRQTRGLYIHERRVVPSGRRSQAPRAAQRWRLVVAVDTAPANFIQQAAIFHLSTSAVAILSLLSLAAYFLRTWQRLLDMKAREEAERHLATLGRMGATLAHEIRNPLGAMKGLTQVVQEQLPREHGSQELISTVVSEAERLELLVNDLLLFARPRQLKLSRIDLAEEVGVVESILGAELDERGVQVTTSPTPVFWNSDADGLRQVLLNILRNALEASSAGNTIAVTVQTDRKQRFLTLTIDDEGSGLGGTDPDTLFEPFKTTKVRGTGLGLAVCKQIIEGLGGTIRLENRATGGTRCTILLPRQ